MSDADRYKIVTLGGRDFTYTFTPAEAPDAPLVVILHGHNKSPAASRYRNPDWNVLCPVDNFGMNGSGSWFLGENGNYFWLEAMPALIAHVYGGDRIFFCGSSMGGYGSILHGLNLSARAVYANIAQTRLLGSSYSERGMKKFFAPIFGDDTDSPFNDLRNLLKPGIRTSFILTGRRWDKPHYLEEQTLPFLTELCRHNVNFQSELQFGTGHTLTYTIAESVGLFEKYAGEIEANYIARPDDDSGRSYTA